MSCPNFQRKQRRKQQKYGNIIDDLRLNVHYDANLTNFVGLSKFRTSLRLKKVLLFLLKIYQNWSKFTENMLKTSIFVTEIVWFYNKEVTLMIHETCFRTVKAHH